MSFEGELKSLQSLRDELAQLGRTSELAALDAAIGELQQKQGGAVGVGSGGVGSGQAKGGQSTGGRKKAKTYLKLKKKYYTPAEVAKRVGVSRQTIVKWIERGELDAEVTPGGHHRIPASVFHSEGRSEPVQLIPVQDETGS